MIHAHHRGPMRKAGILLALLVAGLVVARVVPAPPGASGIAGYEPLHTALETLAIVIAALVFAVGWNTHSRELAGSTVMLACAFLGVGLLDFSHAMSFAGMPTYVTPSGPEKAIDFWLCARVLAALALLTAALAPWRPFVHAATRYLWLAGVLAATGLAHWVILLHPEAAPRTFLPGQGLTGFKVGAEYLLIALNLAAALALWLRMRQKQPFNAAALFVAVCSMALSEYFFTLYAAVTDIYNLMGHLYKVISYLFLYRAVFVETIEQPYRRLRDAESQLQQAVRVARIGIFEHDHLGDSIHWSAEMRELHGYGDDEPVTPASAFECIVPDDRARMQSMLERSIDPGGEGLLDIEYRIVRRDGELRYFDLRMSTLFDGEGSARHPVRSIGAIIDVTESKRTEEVLRASEESLAVTLQSIGDAVIATDLQGRVTRMNTVAERLTGWTLELALRQPLAEVFRIVDAASREALPSPVQQVLSGGEIVGLPQHTLLLARDGRELHISDSAAPIRDASGQVMGVVLVFSDVTEQYRAQRELQRQADALRVRDRALTQISQGVMIVDETMRVSYVNPAFQQITGSSAAEVFGHTPALLAPTQGAPAVLATMRQAVRDGRGFRGEVPYQRKDGTAIWVDLDLTPLRDAQGALTGYVATHRDITERKQAEAERRSLEAQLRESQKMESIGTLAGGIAHDFNNILGAILGNLALARADLPAGHPALASLEQVNKASVRARELVQQILAFSRRQAQELVVQPLRPLVEETLSLLRSTLPARVSLEAQLSDKPLYLDADATQIQQVLMNLCTNAWHALQESTGRITVGLDEVALEGAQALAADALPPGRYLHLWVRDTGIGMDAQTRARIFEPFFTTKSAGQGTGLGLSVVHGIVAAHRGAITVDSTPGQGSTFHLYFPAQEAIAAKPAQPLTEPAALMGGGEHVMYVDDDDVMLLMVERLLQRSGYRVTCCHSPQEALSAMAASSHPVDIVITDYNMPTSSGLELAETLARIHPELPVVISSGYISEELRAGAERVGVQHLLQKQNTFDELTRLLRRVLAAAR